MDTRPDTGDEAMKLDEIKVGMRVNSRGGTGEWHPGTVTGFVDCNRKETL